ncbi:hypothetical protein [Arachidicoccus ginsenosidivorans]|uniref:hypothetical protein n=1 Tax=Arachidicoccus ginsenosidivorans TaxID=496057 RepID=UPI001CEF9F86|nr:hypothetical protein [Arachidicoccus ginsenosidivorans]
MSLGYFNYPLPANEPVLGYAPGSAERAALSKAIADAKKKKLEIPMYIGGRAVRTGKKVEIRPPMNSAIRWAFSIVGKKNI